MSLTEEITAVSIPEFTVSGRYLARLAEGNLTRDEDVASHFCVYFLPYDPKTERVFIVHHKKSGLWLSPGGHIDRNEQLHEALEREAHEELGISYRAPAGLKPFLLTITPIVHGITPCKMHYDIWFGIPTDGSDFMVDPREFHETRWLTIADARKIVIDPSNLEALDKIEEVFAKAPAV